MQINAASRLLASTSRFPSFKKLMAFVDPDKDFRLNSEEVRRTYNKTFVSPEAFYAFLVKRFMQLGPRYKLYRTLAVNNEARFITSLKKNPDKAIGSHWSTRVITVSTNKPCLTVCAYVSKSDINWFETFAQNMLIPEEQELVVTGSIHVVGLLQTHTSKVVWER